jgi:hypothetical protein
MPWAMLRRLRVGQDKLLDIVGSLQQQVQLLAEGRH